MLSTPMQDLQMQFATGKLVKITAVDGKRKNLQCTRILCWQWSHYGLINLVY